jgi:hypothetical protein
MKTHDSKVNDDDDENKYEYKNKAKKSNLAESDTFFIYVR